MRIEVNGDEAALLLGALRWEAKNYPALDELAWHVELQVLDHSRWPGDLERYWPDRQAFIAEVVDVLYDVGRDDLADVLDIEFT